MEVPFLRLMYTFDVKTSASKGRVMGFLLDPFVFTGVIGHINVLQVMDVKKGKYVAPGSLEEPGRDYRVLYVFGTPDTKLNVMLGAMLGPDFSPAGVSYGGKTDDGKFEWRADFKVSADRGETEVRIALDVQYRSGTLDKLLGRSAFQLAQHFVTDHIIPYIKLYLKGGELEVSKVEVARLEVDASQLLTKLRELSKGMVTGVISAAGEDFRATLLVKNGELGTMRMMKGGKLFTGGDVIAKLLTEQGRVRLMAYEVDVEGLMERVGEDAVRVE
ncbi:hypothetical protein [Sulfodiicoccus acidiphilus]|uniref:hypothetical protein n=1 Tax=Sulfodiicoccus acidiphilus TaxID=1670455 RepID=UPI000F848056|nr:hypothetical protein [Sulfodiicoccus acidiphilus]